MNRLWSPLIADLDPYKPGEQPRDRSLIKLNTNESPYGPSPKVLDAIGLACGEGLRRYPDPTARDVRCAIAESFDLLEDSVFVGNGSDEVLAHCFNAFFVRKGPLKFADITYPFYATYCKLYGVETEIVGLDENFEIAAERYRGAKGGVLIANPNALTGIDMGRDFIEKVLDLNPDVVVIVDEAYVDFGARSVVDLVEAHDNLVVVQTFSKARSLAGLRVGFAVGQAHLMEALRRVKDSFNSYPVGNLALAGALAAWKDQDWFRETRDLVIADRDRTAQAMGEQGFRVLPSSANFLLASHPKIQGAELAAEIRSRGILVRHFPRGRTRDWIRITIGTAQECDALLEVTSELSRSRAPVARAGT